MSQQKWSIAEHFDELLAMAIATVNGLPGRAHPTADVKAVLLQVLFAECEGLDIADAS